MSKQKVHSKKNETEREKFINEATLILSTSLVMLKDKLGEKKFEKRIRKAAKILVHGIKEEAPKMPSVTKKVAGIKKITVKPPKKVTKRPKAPAATSKTARKPKKK